DREDEAAQETDGGDRQADEEADAGNQTDDKADDAHDQRCNAQPGLQPRVRRRAVTGALRTPAAVLLVFVVVVLLRRAAAPTRGLLVLFLPGAAAWRCFGRFVLVARGRTAWRRRWGGRRRPGTGGGRGGEGVGSSPA